MSPTGQVLVVSMLADGPYWQSALEILAPPDGASFYRPFSYRSSYADTPLLAMVPDPGRKGPIEAVVGMRFTRSESAESTTAFIPLRRAQAYVIREGDISVNLRLLDFFDIESGTNDFSVLDVPSELVSQDGDPTLVRMATDQERVIFDAWSKKTSPPHRVWSLLARSTVLPDEVKGRFQNQVILYAKEIRNVKSGKRIDVKEIQAGTSSRWPEFGYELEVGQHYEIELESRRISQPGESRFPEDRPRFDLINDPSTVLSSAPSIPFTGNYRVMPTWILPKHRVDAPLHLWWQPEPTVLSSTEPSQIGLRIPFISRPRIPWRPILLAALLLVVGMLSYSRALSSGVETTETAVFLSVGTLLLSIGASQSVEAVRRWEDQEQ